MASARLEALIEMARKREMTPEEANDQLRSFAWGNTHIENSRITRGMVNAAVERMSALSGGK